MELKKNGKIYLVVERAVYTTKKTANLELEKREYYIPEIGTLPVGNIKEYKSMFEKGSKHHFDGLYLNDRFMGDQFVDF